VIYYRRRLIERKSEGREEKIYTTRYRQRQFSMLESRSSQPSSQKFRTPKMPMNGADDIEKGGLLEALLRGQLVYVEPQAPPDVPVPVPAPVPENPEEQPPPG